MSRIEQAELVVVGAGQAALATAFAAAEAGVQAVLLGASRLPAGSWPDYYESLRTFSPARFSSLPGRRFPGDRDRYPARDEVVEYLVDYADWLGADVRLGERVEQVELGDADLTVHTASGKSFRAPRVVAASGSFGAPRRPALKGLAGFRGRVLHAAEYRSPEPFAGRRVVVVGAGNSAVQIAVELAGTAQVTLASRSRPRWFPQRPLGRDVHWWLSRSGLDRLPTGRLSARTLPVLDDGRYRRAIETGAPDRRPIFAALDGRTVEWRDGRREQVDAVILATGYEPDVPYLAAAGALDGQGRPLQRSGLSTTVAGLGFVGLELQRSPASATLRGVGRDARWTLRRLRSRADRSESSARGRLPRRSTPRGEAKIEIAAPAQGPAARSPEAVGADLAH